MTTEVRSTKLPVDLVAMLAEIAKHGGVTVAEIAEPILRRPVERLFDKLPEVNKAYVRERISREQLAPAAK